MDRRLVSGHSPYERVAGFSRAVVAGDRVHVAGTAPIPPDGSPPPEGAYEQAALCLRIIGEALDRAGSGLGHVVRTNIYVTDPVHWDEAGPENWNVLLHCPNCDVYREGVFAQDTVESFDEELDRGGDALARDYKRLMRANMAEEIERFVGALQADAILPEDF